MRYKLVFFIFTFLISISTFAAYKYLQINKHKDIEVINMKSIQLTKVAYNSIFNTHKVAAETYLANLLDNEKAMQILKRFKYEKTEDQKALLRGELFRLLHKKYKKIKKLGVRQFHFHTHDTKSLLRFHQPSKNGDSLIGIRESIKIVNKTHKPFMGFEGGRILPGFRYVFPIIYENDYLGSVEFSISFEAIEKKLQLVLPTIAYQLHLDKSISYDKVFDLYKIFFKKSILLEDHYIENSKISTIEEKIVNNKFIQDIQSKASAVLKDTKSSKEEDFSINIEHQGKGYRINLITIKENNGKSVGYLVSYFNFDELIDINDKYFLYTIILFSIAIILLLLLFLVLKQLDLILMKDNNIQQILNSQENIIILINGDDINFANSHFFDFFGFKNLTEFKKKHHCICDYFLKDDNFFHLGKIKEDENWLEVVSLLPMKKRVVSILGKKDKTFSFELIVNKFDNNFFAVALKKVTHKRSLFYKR